MTARLTKPGGSRNVKEFGASGNGVADDTSAIQDAIDTNLSISGGGLYFPGGNYLISSSLTIPLYTGWRIYGESRGNTTITQKTGNTPIITFTKEGSHSWEISELSFSWTNPQSSAQTNAVAILVNPDTHLGGGVFGGTVNRVAWDKGFRGFSLGTGVGTDHCAWGMTFDNITHGILMTGACISLVPAVSIGQPNNRFGHIYCRADSASESLIQMLACNCFTMQNYEVNANPNGVPLLSASGGCSGVVDAIRCETGTYGASGSQVIQVADSQVNFGTVALTGLSHGAGGTTYKHYLFYFSGGANGFCHIGTLDATGSNISAGDELYALGGANASPPNNYVVDNILSLGGGALTDVDAGTSCNNTSVGQWSEWRVSSNNGDSDLTLDMGDPTVQMFETTLTGNHVVTLPAHSGATCSAFNGARFRIIRNAATPGAFALTVKMVGGATVQAIPSNTKAIVEVMYRRTAWVLTGYTVLA